MNSAGHVLLTTHDLYARSGGSANTSGRPPIYKVIGIVLAITSGLFIGVSFVLKKLGLLKANVKYNEEAGEGYGYPKNACMLDEPEYDISSVKLFLECRTRRRWSASQVKIVNYIHLLRTRESPDRRGLALETYPVFHGARFVVRLSFVLSTQSHSDTFRMPDITRTLGMNREVQ